MRSITLEQAALFAALVMAWVAGYNLAENFALIQDSPALVLLGSLVPSLVWAGFFFSMWRRFSALRSATWITLFFGVILEAIVAVIRFQHSVDYWTPFGNALRLYGWFQRLGWAALLISYAMAPGHAHTRKIALLLAILSAPSGLSTAYNVFNNGIGLLFGDLPRQALWRALITPVTQTAYWFSQILFLWTVWGNPEARNPSEASSSRFTS